MGRPTTYHPKITYKSFYNIFAHLPTVKNGEIL